MSFRNFARALVIGLLLCTGLINVSAIAAVQVWSNNATTTIAGPINSAATSVSVTSGTGSLFPTLSGGNWFIATLQHITAGAVTAQEIVKVTARSGDTMTIVRAQEGTTALSWSAGDTLALLPTAGGLSQFVQPTQLQAQGGNYAIDTGSANAYSVALTPALTSYVVGMPIRVRAANANTTTSTLNAGAGVANILLPSGAALSGGEIAAGGVFTVVWDGAEFQLVSPSQLRPLASYSFIWSATNPSEVNYRIATLPASNGGTLDSIHIVAELNQGWVASGTSTVDIVMGNRGGFTYYWDLYGNIPPNIVIVAYQETDGSVNILLEGAASTFGYARVSVVNVGGGAIVYDNPTATGDTGTIIFNTGADGTYPPLINAPAANTYINAAQIAAIYLTQANAASTYETQSAASLLAPKASPALTGTPTAPTAASGTSTTQLATTAFVNQSVGSTQVVGFTSASAEITTSSTLVASFSNLVSGASYFLEVEGTVQNAGAGSISAMSIVPNTGSITALGQQFQLSAQGTNNLFQPYQFNAASATPGLPLSGANPSTVQLKGAFTLPGGATSAGFYMSANASGFYLYPGSMISLTRMQ